MEYLVYYEHLYMHNTRVASSFRGRLQHLQDCLYYRIQEKGNRSRKCTLMHNGFIFGGGIGERLGHRLWVYLAGGRE